jgi:hypothetical protein
LFPASSQDIKKILISFYFYKNVGKSPCAWMMASAILFSSKYDDFLHFFFPKKKPLSNLHWVFFVMIVQKFSQKTNTSDEEGLVAVFAFLKEFGFVAKVTIIHKKMQKN